MGTNLKENWSSSTKLSNTVNLAPSYNGVLKTH